MKQAFPNVGIRQEQSQNINSHQRQIITSNNSFAKGANAKITTMYNRKFVKQNINNTNDANKDNSFIEGAYFNKMHNN